MNKLEQLKDIAARLEVASGPDREIDAHISIHDGLLFGWCGTEGWYCGCSSNECGAPLGLHDERRSYPVDWREDQSLPKYTSSIDAALGLVERTLPGCGWHISTVEDGSIACWLEPVPDTDFIENAPTAPIAILRAWVAAMIAGEEGK